MHMSDFVTFISTNHQPVREYDVKTGVKERSCSIYLPPGTEYEFGFKNDSNSRRRVDISIDGTKTIDSLIIDRFTSINLERFFDTNKKFMTALKSDGRVSDPSNPDIGKIKIEVYREYEPPKPKPSRTCLRGNIGAPRGSKGSGPGVPICAGSSLTGGGISDEACYSAQYTEQTLGMLSAMDASFQPSSLATVEGNKSNQQLIHTHWNGDVNGELLVFWFTILEKNAELQSITHKFCTSCGMKCELDHRFCAKCGKRF